MPSPRGPSLQRHAVEEDKQGPRAVCDAWQAITFTNNQDSPFLLICFSFDLTSKVPTFEKTSYLWNLALPAGRQITNSREELPLHTVVFCVVIPAACDGTDMTRAEIWVRTRLLKSAAGFLPWFSNLVWELRNRVSNATFEGKKCQPKLQIRTLLIFS